MSSAPSPSPGGTLACSFVAPILVHTACRGGDSFPFMAGCSAQPVKSFYVHVPFCAHKCEYCAFYSEPSRGETIQRYVQALIRELELVAHDLKPQTIFFGGGTPSLLNLRQWDSILNAMERLDLLG